MSSHRLRIFSSLLIAFLMVSFYGRISTSPFITPIEADNIKNLLSNIKFPKLNFSKIFTLNISPENNDLKPLVKYNLTTIPTLGSEDPFDDAQGKPTPTTGLINQTPTTIQPTDRLYPSPKPTNKPRPSPTPKLPPITSNVRPGNTLTEIYQEVNKRLCFPVPLLMAFQTVETGAWVNINEPSSSVKNYNTYGWWTNPAINPCHGFGFDEATGYDSNGVFCMVTPGANPGQMGLFSLNQFEQDNAYKYLKSILPNGIDRRVWFDDALIFAQISVNRLTIAPSDCNNWPDDAITTVAEKHQGSCANSYCANILKYYRQYR